ncbi:hypothetical protein AVEN_154227-1 [Araneus ventricosus]|uniref:Uncharacterized protein n=1 Tax=Araneus ventricosus TaxID=182803 RepID=A0A4Y2GVX8_ARAVE|nr:hypothetical protein AVEN_154227-1 [Araneus ventricosus]
MLQKAENKDKKKSSQIKIKLMIYPRHSRDNVVTTAIPVIKQRDTNEDCAEASTENKLAEGINTSFIEEKSVKDRSLQNKGWRVNGDLLPTKPHK